MQNWENEVLKRMVQLAKDNQHMDKNTKKGINDWFLSASSKLVKMHGLNTMINLAKKANQKAHCKFYIT